MHFKTCAACGATFVGSNGGPIYCEPCLQYVRAGLMNQGQPKMKESERKKP